MWDSWDNWDRLWDTVWVMRDMWESLWDYADHSAMMPSAPGPTCTPNTAVANET